MPPPQLEREVFIAAPIELVWSIVTDAHHLGGWFSDAARIDLRPGGELELVWHEHGTAHGRVEAVDPPRRLAFRWMRDVPERDAAGELGPGNSTLVELRLVPEAEGTRLHVTESGFPNLDWPERARARYAAENRDGWARELGELAAYVDALSGPSGP